MKFVKNQSLHEYKVLRSRIIDLSLSFGLGIASTFTF